MSRLGSAICNRYAHTWLRRLVDEALNMLPGEIERRQIEGQEVQSHRARAEKGL